MGCRRRCSAALRNAPEPDRYQSEREVIAKNKFLNHSIALHITIIPQQLYNQVKFLVMHLHHGLADLVVEH